MLRTLIFVASISSLMHFAQTPSPSPSSDWTMKPPLSLVLIDDKGNQLVPEVQYSHDNVTMKIPFVGIKIKFRYKLPKEIPKFCPTKVRLGIKNPEKGGFNLVRFEISGEFAILKGVELFVFRFQDEFLPLKSSKDVKAKYGDDGIWYYELSKPLSPGIYAIASASASSSVDGHRAVSTSRIFEVPQPK